MIGIIVYAIIKKRITSASYATLLASVTLGNIAVWGIEQIIDIEFEFLSISYIITELFLLMLYIMLQVQEHTSKTESEASVTTKQIPVQTEATGAVTVNSEAEETAEEPIDEYQRFCDGISLLTVTERKIFDLYVSGKSTAETAEAVGIKENTLKFHNKNIYQKLGVSSRKQLLYYANLSNETEASEN
jgi:DNA-binding CsgD family transcriptional regulator